MNEEPVTLEERTEECAKLHEALREAFVELLKQDIELAAQRRTIATLRARLENRPDVPIHKRELQLWDSYLEWPLYFWANVHRSRIAAIRNFGSLPCDAPSMPGYFYDDAWHAKPADGYKGRATFDASLNAWTWWVVGFAGYVRAESYQEARAQAETSLRNLGVLS